MVSTLVMAAALVGGFDPASETQIYKLPGPAFEIPCRLDDSKAVERVQLWVSADGGKSWTLDEEIEPDQAKFTFLARKPGEYWFAARLKKKDGTFEPTKTTRMAPMLRVAVGTGTGYVEPARPAPKPTAAEAAKDLEDELARVEVDLIRRDIKRLAEQTEFTRETEQKIDRLRDRLREIRSRDRGTDPLISPPATVPPLPSVPDETRIPPFSVPTAPRVIPSVVPTEAPMPRARVPRY